MVEPLEEEQVGEQANQAEQGRSDESADESDADRDRRDQNDAWARCKVADLALAGVETELVEALSDLFSEEHGLPI